MPDLPEEPPSHITTIEAARRLGLAVRSVQLMVDRGELVAWRTPGGHRRISSASLEQWLAGRSAGHATAGQATAGHEPAGPEPAAAAMAISPAAVPSAGGQTARARVLLIEDSIHYQNLMSLLIRQRFPGVELHIANDGLSGLVQYGRLLPDVLIIDILLPGIDGASLVTSLRSHEQFAGSRLIVVTSLDEAQREPYAFALQGVPIVHKPRLVADLPPLLERCLSEVAAEA